MKNAGIWVKPVSPKGNQPWIFIGRADAEAPILWPHDTKSQLTGKDPDAWKGWRQEEKGVTEDGWHHQLNGHEFEQAPGDSEGQGRLVCCSPWGHKESDTTQWLNNNWYMGKTIVCWNYRWYFMQNYISTPLYKALWPTVWGWILQVVTDQQHLLGAWQKCRIIGSSQYLLSFEGCFNQLCRWHLSMLGFENYFLDQ